MEREKDEAYIQESQKRDGFKDEQYFIIPTESFKEYLKHPLVKSDVPDRYRILPEGVSSLPGTGGRNRRIYPLILYRRGRLYPYRK